MFGFIGQLQSEGFKMFKMFPLVKLIIAAATAACPVSNTDTMATLVLREKLNFLSEPRCR